jgi:class II lanthipeptide synthase
LISPFRDRPDFYGALTLAERAALPEPPAASSDGDLARQRLDRWRSQPPFEREDFFARRLALDGLDEAGLLALLAETRESLARRTGDSPEWLSELEAAFRQASPDAPLPFPVDALGEPEIRLLGLVSPLLQQAERRLARRVAEIAAAGRPLPFDPAVIGRLVFAGLPGQILWTITRVGVLELNVARLEGRLAGDTPEERFDAFVQLLRCPEEAAAVLERHPVLARQLVVRLRSWTEAGSELLHRLTADWGDILDAFAPAGEPGPVVHVQSGAGDRHRGGRTVCLLTFASGWRLVYKPRPMAVAAHFQEMLGWMNERGFTPELGRLRVLDRGEHGWMELATPKPCATREEVQRFYQRMGGYLCLLYAFDASDFHYENLIAAGEHPLLIDLESIVQPRPPAPTRMESEWLATDAISRSVLRVGLLPQRAWGGAGEGIDISGLGSPAGQLTPDHHPYWDHRGTDTMRLERRQIEMAGGSNQPTLAASPVEVTDHVSDVIDGFSRAYRLLVAHRGELLAENGLLARMAGDEVRAILRPTRTYGLLLQESFHPFLLRDALERDRHFDHLWQGVAESSAMEKVVAAERRDLLAGDIPLFGARLDSYDLLGAGGEHWPGFFERSGLDLVRSRLADLGEADHSKQLWFIRASLAAHHVNLYGPEAVEPPLGVAAAGEADGGRLIEAAAAVGDRLEALALRSNGDATWIGMRSHQGRDWRLTPLGSDLYSGLPGIVVFLAYLAQVTQEDRYDRLARAGWRTLWQQREALRVMLTTIGAFDGWGGLLWALTHLGRLWDDRECLQEARAIVELLPDFLARDTVFDVVTGAAGCIAGLLALHRAEPSDRALAVACACGEHLLAHARPMERGAAWMSSSMSGIASQPLAGFAHGASGNAWTLLELAVLTGDDRFRRAALAAFDYERSLLHPEQGNWRDVRSLEKLNIAKRVGDDTFMLAWCHGAPGAGLARLRAVRHVDDPRLRAEAEIALASTLSGGFDHNHSLCHGDLGNAELLLQAAESLDDGERWRAEARRAADRVLASIARYGWVSGLPRGVEVPGLMTGLAGIGYGLLRLAMPERIPSVLLLDPPVAA